MARRVRKGDLVAVVSGDDKGKRGRILRVLPEKNRVIVEGVNLVYKHMRRSQQNPQGGRVRREAPIHASNVMPIDPETSRPTRVRMRTEAGRRVRVTAQSGTLLDAVAKKSRKDADAGEES
jgi:large subunit ribosomal protein L24